MGNGPMPLLGTPYKLIYWSFPLLESNFMHYFANVSHLTFGDRAKDCRRLVTIYQHDRKNKVHSCSCVVSRALLMA